MRSKLPKALSDERKRKEVEEKQRQVQQLEEELGKGVSKKEIKYKSRTYNLLDIKEAVQIKPSDYSKTINTKEFQFVQKPKVGMANWEGSTGTTGTTGKKGRELHAKYDLT